MTIWIRKNIGMVFSFLGFFLLSAITFGNIVDVFTPKYWENVCENFASIGMLSVALVFIQSAIKQGICEQALSRGLNSDYVKEKYTEHKAAIERCESRIAYVLYFLDNHNLRDTARRKRKFLINNKFTSEKSLLASKNKRIIRQYNAIATDIRLKDIKWTSTEVIKDKYGRIETLSQYRKKRAIKGTVVGSFTMLFTTLMARELFNGADGQPLWVKFLRLGVYIITIAASVAFGVLKNYEKGAFGVPNDLDEINSIWREFEKWKIPAEIVTEVERNQIPIENKEVPEADEKGKESPADSGAVVQEESKEIQVA